MVFPFLNESYSLYIALLALAVWIPVGRLFTVVKRAVNQYKHVHIDPRFKVDIYRADA